MEQLYKPLVSFDPDLKVSFVQNRISRKLHAFALQTPKLIVDPAQLRTSAENSSGSLLSYPTWDMASSYLEPKSYQSPSIYTNDEIEPRIQREFLVVIAQYLETTSSMYCCLGLRFTVQAWNESI